MSESDSVFVKEVYAALGWQGGTIHQVVDEINKLRSAASYTAKRFRVILLNNGAEVLLYRKFDNEREHEADVIEVSTVFDMDGLLYTPTATMAFANENDAIEALNGYTQASAEKFYVSMKKLYDTMTAEG